MQSLQSLLPFKPELDLCPVTNISIFPAVFSPLVSAYPSPHILVCIFPLEFISQ